MTKEEFAQLLNGRQYRKEMTREEESLAKEKDLLIVFGYSDDNIELRGIIYDELSCYDGDAFNFLPNVNKASKQEDDFFPIIEPATNKVISELGINSFTIDAKWSPKELRTSWLITCNCPYASFDIYEDDELYCRGLVTTKQDILNMIGLNMIGLNMIGLNMIGLNMIGLNMIGDLADVVTNIKPRRKLPLDNPSPNGNLEGDLSYVDNNRECAVWLLENAHLLYEVIMKTLFNPNRD